MLKLPKLPTKGDFSAFPLGPNLPASLLICPLGLPPLSIQSDGHTKPLTPVTLL